VEGVLTWEKGQRDAEPLPRQTLPAVQNQLLLELHIQLLLLLLPGFVFLFLDPYP
jgi:hypothetical protein